MAEYVHLIGAEDVRAAGSRMASAADDMQRAASSIDNALERHQRFLDDWLFRFESVMDKAARSASDFPPTGLGGTGR
jgi:hypothetical protein